MAILEKDKYLQFLCLPPKYHLANLHKLTEWKFSGTHENCKYLSFIRNWPNCNLVDHKSAKFPLSWLHSNSNTNLNYSEYPFGKPSTIAGYKEHFGIGNEAAGNFLHQITYKCHFDVCPGRLTALCWYWRKIDGIFRSLNARRHLSFFFMVQSILEISTHFNRGFKYIWLILTHSC